MFAQNCDRTTSSDRSRLCRKILHRLVLNHDLNTQRSTFMDTRGHIYAHTILFFANENSCKYSAGFGETAAFWGAWVILSLAAMTCMTICQWCHVNKWATICEHKLIWSLTCSILVNVLMNARWKGKATSLFSVILKWKVVIKLISRLGKPNKQKVIAKYISSFGSCIFLEHFGRIYNVSKW